MTLERRFHEMWSALAAVGASSSSSSGVAAGYNRFAWSAVDLELRRWFRDEARAFGLEVEQDRNGNLWAWWDVEGRHAHPGGDGGRCGRERRGRRCRWGRRWRRQHGRQPSRFRLQPCRGHRDRGHRDRGQRDRGHRDRGHRDGGQRDGGQS